MPTHPSIIALDDDDLISLVETDSPRADAAIQELKRRVLRRSDPTSLQFEVLKRLRVPVLNLGTRADTTRTVT